MDDSTIIDLFFERSEKAIFELANKYGKIFMSLSLNIVNDYHDAEECVNDSYLGVWNSIPPNKPNPLLSYVCRIVRNISVNRYKRNHAEKRKGNYDLCLEELEKTIGLSAEMDDSLSVREISSYIEEFLDSLDEINRMIFVRRFWYMDSYKKIAKESKLKESTVRVRMLRVKSNLKDFLAKKGVTV